MEEMLENNWGATRFTSRYSSRNTPARLATMETVSASFCLFLKIRFFKCFSRKLQGIRSI